ncbi:glycoside hydrolase family 15 protein [Streptomyces orinoci]|uniref:alpha-amylase n=1 Tax=Streptomyces orinoci TaxID=67339 RepID=A0ABV3JYW8_STRON|nr:glycoside hydrolase family 15 protein [Streptomyces orinoci]
MKGRQHIPWHRTTSWLAALALTVAGLAATGARTAVAAPAPGAPGAASHWNEPRVDGFADALSPGSKVWYTLGDGQLANVFHPRPDSPATFGLKFLVTDGTGFTDDEVTATRHTIALADPGALEWRQTNTANSGRYRLTKTYVADPARSVVLVRTTFSNLSGNPLSLYAHYSPALGNQGMGNTGATDDGSGALAASNGPEASALAASTGFSATSTGYAGTPGDGERQLATGHALSTDRQSAETPGHITQTARIPVAEHGSTTFTLALGFNSSRQAAVSDTLASLRAGFAGAEASFRAGWHSWLSRLHAPPSSVSGDARLREQYQVSLMELKADEDKTYRGGFVAAPVTPWGAGVSADARGAHGYHLVWTRDEYQMATALLAAGDTADANDALDYILAHEVTAEGSVKQNSWLDGTQEWGGTQEDQVAFPLILAWQLGRKDAATWAALRPLAEHITAHGPATGQERWEENGGYSPSTMAAEVAGLVCAADLARANGASAAADGYLARADAMRVAVDATAYTTTGPLGSGSYYLRISPHGDPDAADTVNVANGGGSWDQRALVDQGFLELTRLGVKPASSPRIAASLAVVDATIRTTVPGQGEYWGRYNHDGYGETADGGDYTGSGLGRPWPVLGGERGEFAVQRGDLDGARRMLLAMAAAANDGRQISEQIWTGPGQRGFTQGRPDNSATPLMWAMAQYVRLAIDISAGRTVETPAVVAQRYAGDSPPGKVEAAFHETAATQWGQNVYVVGSVPELGAWDPARAVPLSPAAYPRWSATVALPASATVEYKYLKKNPDGSVSWESDPNRRLDTGVSGPLTVTDTWR